MIIFNFKKSLDLKKQLVLLFFSSLMFIISLSGYSSDSSRVKSVLEDFEGKIKWKRAFISKGGKAHISVSNDKIFEKGYVGKIEYDFENPNGQVCFFRNINLKAIPKRIGVWINSNKALRIFLRLRDAKGETFQWTASFKPDPNGEYRYIEYFLMGGKNQWGGDKNGKIDLPVKSIGILISSTEAGSGTVYLDFISVPKEKQKAAPAKKKVNSGGLPAELELQKLLKKDHKKSQAKKAKFIPKSPFKVEAPLPVENVQLADAMLPDGVILDWSLKNSWKQETATRGRICLNGLWKFRPTWNSDKGLPKSGSGWGFLKVPGGWPCSHRWGHNPYSFIPIAPKCWDKAIGPMDINRGNWHYSNRKIGESIPFDKVKDAWYQREFEVPASWSKRRVFLRFDTIEQRARVYVNGKWAGAIFWPDGYLEITALVESGEKNLLTVRAFTPNISVGAGPRGIAGDVFIESESNGPRITDLFVISSWRNKNITLKLEFADLDPYQQYFLEGNFIRNNKLEKKVKSPIFITADLIDKKGSFSWQWDNPALWDFGKGEMYDLNLILKTVDGKTVDAQLPKKFGFRDFYVQGKHFMLNGRKIHFFGEYFREYGRSFANVGSDVVKTFIKTFQDIGYNLIKFSIYDYNAKLTYYPEEMVRAADQAGMAILFQLPRIRGHKASAADWANWRKKISGIIKRWRDHPSIFFWSTDQGTGHFVEALNPRNFAGYNQHAPTRTDFWNKVKMGTHMTENFINNLDETRVVIHLGGGNIGKVVSVYPYYNFTEIQEQREHPLFWVKNGSKPLFYSEWGIPFTVSFTAHRTNNPFPAKKGIPFKSMQPLFAEFAAITQGDKAYQLGPQAKKYAAYLDKIQREGEGDGRWMNKIVYSDMHRNNLIIEKNYLTIQNERLRQLVPYFRAMEMSGIIPYSPRLFVKQQNEIVKDHWLRKTEWNNLQRPGINPDIGIPGDPYSYSEEMMDKFVRKTSQFHALKKVQAPEIAFIAGGPEKLTTQNKNYSPGEKIGKIIVVVNDQVNDDNVTCKWVLKRENGKTIDSGKINITVKAGEVGRRLLTLTAPKVNSSETLTLEADFSGKTGKIAIDKCLLNIIPTAKHRKTVDNILLWDKNGKTASEFDALNLRYQRIKAKDFPAVLQNANLLVIGRETLDLTTPLNGLPEKVKDGLRVLIMEQDQDVLRYRLGFRTNDPAPRKTWKRISTHPAFKDLPDGALSFWRGNSTMLEAYPTYNSDFPYAMGKQAYVNWHGFTNKHVWKWGNTNAVASVVIEKPHTGNFTPLADCGFDLQYTSLLEFTAGKGRIIFCQYDISGRTERDPAAKKLLLNCVDYLLDVPPRQIKGLLLDADKQTEDLLNKLRISGNAPVSTRKVAVLASGASGSAKDVDTVFSLSLSGEQISKLTGRNIKTKERPFSSSFLGWPKHPLLQGIGNTDFYLRGEVKIPALQQSGQESFYASGGVMAIYQSKADKPQDLILYQIRPDLIDFNQRPHLKLSYLKTMRTLRQLLVNTGLDSASPLLKDLASPVGKNETPRWLDSYYVNRPEAADDPYRYQHW